jgi:hypothetical protein
MPAIGEYPTEKHPYPSSLVKKYFDQKNSLLGLFGQMKLSERRFVFSL